MNSFANLNKMNTIGHLKISKQLCDNLYSKEEPFSFKFIKTSRSDWVLCLIRLHFKTTYIFFGYKFHFMYPSFALHSFVRLIYIMYVFWTWNKRVWNVQVSVINIIPQYQPPSLCCCCCCCWNLRNLYAFSLRILSCL